LLDIKAADVDTSHQSALFSVEQVTICLVGG
jgi:hypothetical protein